MWGGRGGRWKRGSNLEAGDEFGGYGTCQVRDKAAWMRVSERKSVGGFDVCFGAKVTGIAKVGSGSAGIKDHSQLLTGSN